MIKIKIVLLTFLIGLMISSCSKKIINVHTIAIPAGIDNTVHLSKKSHKMTADEAQNWMHLSLAKDTLPGMDMDRAYQFLAGKKAKTIIVGVIDSGEDIDHEDLVNVIWSNEDEIAGNGVDDDKNGFVDDIHGWNFLGDILEENLEITRMVKMYQARFAGKTMENIRPEHQADFKQYKELEDIVKQKFEKSGSVYYDLDFHGSADELKNNRYNYSIKIYGDSNVKNKNDNEAHSTHVAGIIAGDRTNNIGMNGISNHSKIMAVRVVPEGDEYDKDVAMAIRYAVDNGARVINMSFGKSYSPNKEWVGEAFKYAAKHDVLILHSAGNSANDIDDKHTYPNDAPDYKEEWSDNVLTIGALAPSYSEKLVARFSNYGKESVDIFAPGVQIYSTIPGGYAKFSGTSMATPATAGVAALIRAYYPQLSASQVKHIIMNSGTKIDMEVNVPGKDKGKKPFSELCKSGRIVNAYNALVLASKVAVVK